MVADEFFLHALGIYAPRFCDDIYQKSGIVMAGARIGSPKGFHVRQFISGYIAIQKVAVVAELYGPAKFIRSGIHRVVSLAGAVHVIGGGRIVCLIFTRLGVASGAFEGFMELVPVPDVTPLYHVT